MSRLTNNPITRFFFFGNYFYGLCAVMLSIEASTQQRFPLNSWLYYTLVFSVTVLFYTRAYISNTSGYPSNLRDSWYRDQKGFVKYSQWTLYLITLTCLIIYIVQNKENIRSMSALHALLYFVFPFLAAMYYGIDSKLNIRKFGLLKPFVIGASWAGVVTWYPVLETTMIRGEEFVLYEIPIWLFLKNFLFISVLCILFDIKDYADDARLQLQTFVVNRGLRNTIFYLVIPIAFAAMCGFVFYALRHDFHPVKIGLNLVPFLLMIYAAYSLKERKSIMYYLVYVDGLMLVKGVCGFVAMKWF